MAANQERDFTGQAATLLLAARSGTLATVAAAKPHAALATPAVAADGSVIFLLSELSTHTRNLRADPAAALLVAGAGTGENPQTTPRLLLSGQMQTTSETAAKSTYLAAHPYAAAYSGFGDFHFWRLIFTEAHYIGGFAAAAALDPAALQHEIILKFKNTAG